MNPIIRFLLRPLIPGLPFGLYHFIMILFGGLSAYYIFKILTSLGAPPLEIVILSPGANHHDIIDLEGLDQVYKFEEEEYQIKPEAVYRKSRFLRRDRFYCLFRKGTREALVPRGSEVDPTILAKITDSGVLRNMLRELFERGIPGGKVLFIIIIISVAVVLVLKFQGFI